MEITIKIDGRNKQAKALLAYLKTLPFIDIKDKGKGGMGKPTKEKNPYNPEFVKKVKKSAASKKRYVIDDIDEFWKNL